MNAARALWSSVLLAGLATAQVDQAALVGVVVDGKGAPVADAKVEVFECLGRGCTCFDEAFRNEWTPVASGFAFTGLAAGNLYVVLRGAGHAFAVYHLPEPNDDRSVDVGRLVVQSAHLVRAAVRDAQGKPLAGVRMRLFGINADMDSLRGQGVIGFSDGRALADRFAYTDADGTVCFGAVAAGKYQLGFDADPQPMVPDDAIEVEVTAAGAPPALEVSRAK